MERGTVLYIYGDSRTYDVTLCRKTLLIELNAFDASTKRTGSQILSSYIACIACMVDSQPASCPAQTCSDPTDVANSVRSELQLLYQLYDAEPHLYQ